MAFDPYAETVEGGYDIQPPSTGPHAVPVYADRPIPTEPRPTRDLTTGQRLCNIQPVPLLNANPNRVRAFIKAVGGTVYIGGKEQTATATAGFPLTPTDPPHPVTTRHQVWVGAATDGGATAAFVAEHLDG